jgi:hypothetical protein
MVRHTLPPPLCLLCTRLLHPTLCSFKCPSKLAQVRGMQPFSMYVCYAGFLNGGGGRLLAAALVFILVTIVWTLGHMIPFFYLMRMLGLLRVSEDEELQGLDVSHHGGSAYRGNSNHGGVKGKLRGDNGDGDLPVGNDLVTRLVNLENRNVELERKVASMQVQPSK